MKQEITERSDIEFFVHSFYAKLLEDPSISFFFEHLKKDLDNHLNHIVDFWETILLDTNSYQNNTLKIHQKLHQRIPLNAHHFEIWLNHFNTAIDQNFTGAKAILAKKNAASIASIIQLKLKDS